MNSKPIQTVQQATLIETELPIFPEDGHTYPDIETAIKYTIPPLAMILHLRILAGLSSGLFVLEDNIIKLAPPV